MSQSTLQKPTVAPTRARLATYAFFFIVGIAFSSWVVNIPAIQAVTGVSKAVLGTLILLFGAGSFVGMQITGPLVDRWGSRRLSLFGAILLAVGVMLPGFAVTPWELALALVVFGLGMGVIDVAMNAQAVVVEKAYGRPIMSSFHAMFSVGTGVGALIGAGTKIINLTPHWSLGIAAVITLAISLSTAHFLLNDNDAGQAAAEAQLTSDAAPLSRGQRTRMIALLAGLAVVMMLAEGTASDWSTVHAVDVMHQSDAAAALAYFAFAVSMTIGRFVTDPIVHRVGPAQVVRFGSAIGALGLFGVMFAPNFVVTLIAWFVFGLGISGIIPQIFTAAGRLGGDRPGVVISRVVGAGYLGLLAGPALVGWLAQVAGLNLAMVLPLACCALGLALAGTVSERKASTITRS